MASVGNVGAGDARPPTQTSSPNASGTQRPATTPRARWGAEAAALDHQRRGIGRFLGDGSEAYARCRHWQVWGSARPAVRDPLHAKAPSPGRSGREGRSRAALRHSVAQASRSMTAIGVFLGNSPRSVAAARVPVPRGGQPRSLSTGRRISNDGARVRARGTAARMPGCGNGTRQAGTGRGVPRWP